MKLSKKKKKKNPENFVLISAAGIKFRNENVDI